MTQIRLHGTRPESDCYTNNSVVMRQELTEVHHGPESLRGKYQLVGSDDEGNLDVAELVGQLDAKQRKRLLK